jgi:hypothetical protein
MHPPRSSGGWWAAPTIPPLCIASCTAAALAAGCLPAFAPEEEDPRLVVVVVVDQLRADLLDRYAPDFTGGIRRLLDEGLRFTDASHRHAVSQTVPGHASLVTGVHPSRHGLVANSWTELSEGGLRVVEAASDTVSRLVPGSPGSTGRSPANLLRDGLPDWIFRAHPGARVVSISGKDGAAVVLGGSSGGHVYWLEPSRGRFETSTRYRTELPGWVQAFNRDRMPELVTLPRAWSRSMPDRATAELARVAVRELGLGRGPAPDYLAVSFSQTDVVGHSHGPLGPEQRDNLLHLDQVLGELLELLDAAVGRDRWVLGFSADHGVMDRPEDLLARGLPGRRLGPDERALIRATAREARSGARTLEERRRQVAAAVEELAFIDRAFPGEPAPEEADSFAVLFRNSFREDRPTGLLSGYGVMLHGAEGTLVGDRTGRGSDHGTAYHYDRHVPLIFLGRGVEPGSRDAPAASVDFAPTLAGLAGVPVPVDLDGRPLLAVRNRGNRGPTR